jgi:NAD(P)-dependent dehydrogenase (short-subunit alcohol dehydrogenase family)
VWPEPFAADELAGRTAPITGAARGIGGALATRFCELGGGVVVSDLDAVGAERKARELLEAGHHALGTRLDVRSTDVDGGWNAYSWIYPARTI